ncbi:MAG: hypothetical protein JNL51_09085 [Chitinophagaceae bacterium]|nr:hypothetical protein [Chitinophagaceae bacterium]
MYTGLLHLHNLLRWVILILLVIAIVKSLSGMTGKKPFTKGDKKIGLFLMISAHIQLLIGLYEWFFGAWGLKLIQKTGMGEAMKEPAYRFWAVEHITGMLIAIILITIGRGASKKNISDQAKHTKTFWFFLIAFILILSVVPWPFREAIARPLFPGM